MGGAGFGVFLVVVLGGCAVGGGSGEGVSRAMFRGRPAKMRGAVKADFRASKVE